MTPTPRGPAFLTGVKLAAVAVAGLFAATAPAGAQDLTFRFTDPSFGGNPFYSDHLLAIANLDRPSAPSTPNTPTTQEDLIAQQIRAQLLSQLSGTIRDAIANAPVGGTGNYVVGNQTISFVRTATETTVTFTNTTTGEVNTVIIPAASGTSPSAAAGTTSVVAAAGAVPTATAAPGSLAGVSLGAAAPLGYSAGRALASAAASAGSRRGSAEQALIASSSTGAALPPF